MFGTKQQHTWTLSPLRITLLYAVSGTLWILFSDRLLAGYMKDHELLTRFQTYTEWFFVLATSALLFILVKRYHSEQHEQRATRERSEEYNRMLFTQSPIGLALCKMDGTMIDVNPAFARIIGRSVEETLKLTYWDVTPPKYAEMEQTQLRELNEAGQYGPYEKEYVHRDGGLVPVRLQGLLVERDGEQFIWSSVEDITERKKAEAALQRSERLLRLFVQHSPAAIAMFDNNMKYIEASRRFRLDYGLGDQNIIGRSHYEVFPDIPERWKEIHRRCLAGAVEKSEEDAFPRADGKTDWVRWEIHPWHEAHGEIGGIILFSEVITERKRAEEERHLFVSLANNSKEFIGISDLNLIPFYANAAALNLVGLPDLEAVRRIKVQDVFFPEDQPFVTDEFLPRVLREGSGEVEIRFRHFQTGEAVWMLYNVFAIHDARGELAGWATVSRNINDRKKAELELEKHREHLEDLVVKRTTDLQDSRKALMNIVEDLKEKTAELAQANEKLKEVDRLKSLFIASMSHELRTPLNSIIGFTGILLQGLAGPMNEEQKKQLGMVKGSSEHLLSLITDIIDLGKIEAGRIDLSTERFDLAAAVRVVMESFHVVAEGKGLKLKVDAPERLMISSDPRRVRQVLVNLVGNAVKFTENGSVGVSLEIKNNLVEVSVRDTGPGIKDADMARLFQSFSQVVTADVAKHEGSGLGLYLSKRLVNLLGGEIRAESKYGKGSVFRFTLPMDQRKGP